jgi:hypothetical protein
MGLWLDDAHRQVERYEHLGEVHTLSLDLRRRYDEVVSARRVLIPESEADLVISVDFASPVPIAWEWFHDPARRNQWSQGVQWSALERPGGRTSSGARNHCAHGGGGSTEVVLDWRPFEYSTLESSQNGKKVMTETVRFKPLPGGGTRLSDAIQLHMPMPLPRPLRRMIARQMLQKVKYDQMLLEAARLAKEGAGVPEAA